MRYIKTFESITPQVGDYVKMRTDSKNISLINYYHENIGQIIGTNLYHVTVSFKAQPPKETPYRLFFYNYKTEQYQKTFNINKIVDFAKTEENLINQIKYDTKKYNI